jgi:gluconokinase
VIVVVMGVCGCGKTTVGRVVAEAAGWPFLDADDFHPPANVAKMRAGIPLTDDDRWPWLERLADELAAINARGEHAVLACSALRQAYRDQLMRAGDVRFVHLKGDRETIAPRLAERAGHYMPATLLDSQLATLEEPRDAVVVDIRLSVPEQAASIAVALDLKTSIR